MEKTVCPYCNKKLVTPFSCRRHIELCHSKDHIAAMEKACDLLEEGSNSDEEEDNNNSVEEEEEESKKEEDEEEEEEDDEVDDHKPWMALLEGALETLKEDGKMDNVDEVLHDPKFSMLIDALINEVHKVVTTCGDLENTPIYKALNQTLKKNLKDGMNDAEANEAAWDKRKQLIKLFVRVNMDEISEVWNDL